MNGENNRAKIIIAAAGVAAAGAIGYVLLKKKQEEEMAALIDRLNKSDKSGTGGTVVIESGGSTGGGTGGGGGINGGGAAPIVATPPTGITPAPGGAPYVPEANPCDALPIIQKTLCNLGAGIVGAKTVEQRVLEIASDNVKKEKFYADATIDRGVHQVPGLVSTGTHTGEGVVEYLTYKVNVPNARLWIDWKFSNGRTTSTAYNMTPYEACNQRPDCFTEFGIKPCTLLDYGCMFARGVGKY